VALLNEGLALAGDPGAGPILDAGCSVGRTTFELAERFDGLVLGVDMNFSMLQLAARAMREGEIRYDRRRVGLVYERRSFAIRFPRAENVDFWACDAQALPLPARAFSLAVSMNLLDCLASPYDHLVALSRALAPGASAVLTSPYDWSPGATPIESWIGGHSQRGPEGGSSEAAIRALIAPSGRPGAHPSAISGLELAAEVASRPWLVRVHDRSLMRYAVHLVVAKATDA
jgi:SAM-dependent methyltransferase